MNNTKRKRIMSSTDREPAISITQFLVYSSATDKYIARNTTQYKHENRSIDKRLTRKVTNK